MATIRQLMQRLASMHPTTLYSADSYALQVTVTAGSAPEALFIAVAGWRWAESSLQLPAWRLNRAEVITPEEFERERKAYSTRASAKPANGEQEEEEGLEERLLRQVFHDPLTGLPNRELFLDQLERALHRSQRSRATHALLLYDLDDFRAVNQQLGEEAADAELVRVADRLATTIRPEDSIARLGGDRFAILLEHSSAAAAELVATRLLEAVDGPEAGPDERLVLPASMGVAVSKPGQDPNDLIRMATYALSKAKELGGGGYAFFDSDYRPRDVGRVERAFPRRPDKHAYTLLLQAAGIASEETSLEEAARLVLGQVCTHTGWSVGHLYVVPDHDPGRLQPSTAWYTARPDRFAGFVEATGRTVLGRGMDLPGSVLASGRPAWQADLSSAAAVMRTQTALAAGLRAGYSFPVLVGEEVVGVLEFYAEEHVEPDDSLKSVMSAVGVQLGRVVERARANTLRRSEEAFRASARSVQAELARRAAEFRALVQNSSDMVSVVTADGTLRQHYGTRVLGYEEGDKVGVSILELVHPDDRASAVAALAELVSRPGPGRRPVELRVRHADMSWRWLEVVGNNLLDDPDVAGLVLSCRDVTDRKLTESAPGPARSKESSDAEARGSVVR